jgi:hypothetical protein
MVKSLVNVLAPKMPGAFPLRFPNERILFDAQSGFFYSINFRRMIFLKLINELCTAPFILTDLKVLNS